MGQYNFADIEKRKKIYNRLLKTLYKLDKEESKKEIYKINQNQETIDDIIFEIDKKVELIISKIEILSEIKNTPIANKIKSSIRDSRSYSSSTSYQDRDNGNNSSNGGFPFGTLLMGMGLGYLISEVLEDDSEEELLEPEELNDENISEENDNEISEIEDENNIDEDSEDELAFTEDTDEDAYRYEESDNNDWGSDDSDDDSDW